MTQSTPSPGFPDSEDAIAYAPIHALAERIRNGTLSASALLDCYLKRIHRYNDKLHAFIALYEENARMAAELADRAVHSHEPLRPLHGMPIAYKDLLHIDGRTATGGSLLWRDQVSACTATVVHRLTTAGMIAIGKTHMVEFAFGSWGTNQGMGTPWNPWDAQLHRVPGGSSSGSGVAVAAGLVPAAIGSDTGGSVRIPASLCGIVGLKTTIGRLSNHGVRMLSPTLDTMGPMTRDVEDAALLFVTMQGSGGNDNQPASYALDDVLADLERGVAGLRLAVLPMEELGDVDAEVTAAFAACLDVFRTLGAHIATITLPADYGVLADLTGKIIAAEGYRLHRDWIERDDLPFDTDVRDRLRAGRMVSETEYARLMTEQKRIASDVGALMMQYDALLLPTTPLAAIPVSEVDQRHSPMSRLTRPVNLLGFCALAVPCGFTQRGLPISLQIVGRGYTEARVLRIGWAFENATDWHKRRPAMH